MEILSIHSALREQNLYDLFCELKRCLPDLSEQYSTLNLDSEYLQTKVRGQHAFQIDLTIKALDILIKEDIRNDVECMVTDVGDSSGTHIIYLKCILKDDTRFATMPFRFLSINVDPVAVRKIQSKGMEAMLCRAEDLVDCINQKADLIMSFQMLEHLTDPVEFLNKISRKAAADYLIVTVPYLLQSRVGLHHIRHEKPCLVYPENTHIFEFSPQDWKLILMHSGWQVIDEVTYLQYPRKSWLKIMKPFWRHFDFEGFYGVIAKRNRRWAECYKEHTDNIVR
ncbi:MAG: methyltransferase domain-containing protein [Syntrophorhabdaceae bacterium]